MLFSIVKKLLPFLALLCIPTAHAQGRFNPNQLPTNTVLHSGNAVPLFNTSINNQTQTFTILGTNANTVFGNCTNSFGLPSFCSLTSAMEPSTTVNAVTNDTNVTGTITAQNFAIAWSGVLAVSRGGTGVGTISGLIKGNGTSPFSAATSADVISLWSGTCNSSTFLRGDGSCQAAGGGGSSAFNAITTGTNTGASMLVGSGASLGVTGSGTIDATTLGAHTFANPGPIGSGTASTGAFTTITGALTGNVTGNVSGTAASFTGNLTGDTTSAGMATTTVKVNGTSVPTNSAADQVLGTTASATGSWLSVPNCLDSAGNHINYNTSTHAFSCGTSSSGGGTTSFSSLTGSTNTTASMVVGSGASLGITGTGTINATSVNSTTVPVNSAADQVLNTSASATGQWATLPSCLDSAGNHLNYNTSTHAFSCGTSASGSGTTSFSSLTGSTNTTAAMLIGTGASLGPTGSGTIDATTLLTKSWASPAAIGTGTPAAITGTTITANTGFVGSLTGNVTGNVSGTAGSFTGNLTGDTTSVGMATTTVAVNGTTVPINSAADQVLLTTSSATGAWKSVPNCTDSSGNHINYTASTHAFSCGTTASSCPTCVVASSPGLGIAHFAGGTQTATSSLIDLTADVTGLLPNANLAHASTTLNGQTCTLGLSCSLPIQTNSTNNTSQDGLNLLTSTVNTIGLTVTPTNTATNQETFEVTGNTLGSTSNYMTAYINTLIWGGSQLFIGGQSAISCPALVSPYIGGLCLLGPDSLPQTYNVNAAAWRDPATLDGGTFTAGHILAVGTNAPDVTDTGKALAGSGAGITTGPTSSVSGDFVSYTGTAGQTADSGIAATATGLNTAIKTLTGCNTATFVYTPQAADCVAPSGGGSGVSYGYISAAGAAVGLTNPDIIAAYNYVKVTGARTITRISLFFATAPSGCSTYPVFGVYINGGGSGTTLTAANSQTTDDSGAISISVSAGQTIQVGVITAEAGCSTKAAYPVETIEYQ